MAEQGRKLFLTLATVVDALDRLDTIVPVARELAIRHVAYGAKECHYAAIGSALIETLRVGLGRAFDRDTEQAWSAAYAILSRTMLTAVRERAYREDGRRVVVIGTRIDEAGTLIRDGAAFYLRRDVGGRYELELQRTPVNLVEKPVRLVGTLVGKDLVSTDGVAPA